MLRSHQFYRRFRPFRIRHCDDVHENGSRVPLPSMNGIEPSVIQRAVGGDREAFAIIVERRWTPLVSMARSVLGDLEAEDAVQDGLVLAWRRRESLRDNNAFVAWLTRVVLRVCLRRAGQKPNWVPLALVADRAARPRDPVAGLDVARCLAQLAPRQRAVMHLTVIEGMSDREIGHALAITAGSVRAHRRRARTSLERHFDRPSQQG